MPEPIRVVIVDDHTIVRSGLRAFLSVHEDMAVVGEAANGAEAIDVVGDTQPDVVLMDLRMPVMEGPEAIEVMLQADEPPRIVALTTFEDPSLAQRALAAGAIGFLYKDADEEELLSAIRLAHRGRSVIASGAMRLLVDGDPDEYVAQLTEREHEVLALVARGRTNPEISDSLSISVSTVNFHVHNVLEKLGAKTRTEAVGVAVREGILEL
jgi:NarL family two-component system response regulator LiaR